MGGRGGGAGGGRMREGSQGMRGGSNLGHSLLCFRLGWPIK